MRCGKGQEPAVVIDDIALAARSDLPVLVTGPFSWAVEVVCAIARKSGRTINVLECDRSVLEFDRSNVLDVADGVASSPRDDIIWVPDVGRLDRAGQRALREILNQWPRGAGGRAPRLIASSSVDLFARVQADAFDHDLFYAMNAIHIIQPESSLMT